MNEYLMVNCHHRNVLTPVELAEVLSFVQLRKRQRWVLISWRCRGCGQPFEGWFDLRYRELWQCLWKGAPKPHSR